MHLEAVHARFARHSTVSVGPPAPPGSLAARRALAFAPESRAATPRPAQVLSGPALHQSGAHTQYGVDWPLHLGRLLKLKNERLGG